MLSAPRSPQCAPDTVRLLLESQANPRVVDSGGNLPLHLAAGAIDAKGGNETRGLQARARRGLGALRCAAPSA